ncbi:P-loop containing nucleoside triphosphate hydrolase protein [Trichoderma austrokoningii]
MMLARLWKRPVLSVIASSALGRLGVQRQFPMAIANIQRQRGYAKGVGSGEKKKKKKKKKKKEEEEVAKVELKQDILSSIVTAAKATLGKLNGIHVVPVEARTGDTSEKQSPSSAEQEVVLSAEQEALVSLALEGHNIFYTGSAGCGKSTVLKAIRARFEARDHYVHVLAPTGKVALANRGRTTWSFAGWTPNSHKMSLSELTGPFNRHNRRLFKRLAQVKTIIIDEISMVENVHFGRLNELMKAANQSRLPFGGVQIIVTGDFCQLPPVKPFRNCFSCGSELEESRQVGTYSCMNQQCDVDFYDKEDKWAFRSKAWQECNFRNVYLAAIYRQTDPAFKKLLQKCRLGLQLSDADMKLLTNPDGKTNSHAVKLFPTRAEVREVNVAEFRRLQAPPQVYKSVDISLWHKTRHWYLADRQDRADDDSLIALSDHNLEVELQLKKGMQVLLLHNLDLKEKLCNGSQGEIIGFEPFGTVPPKIPLYNEDLPVYGLEPYTTEEEELQKAMGINKEPSKQEIAIQEFMRKCQKAKGWPKVRFHNGIVKTIYPVCHSLLLGEERPYSLMGRMQIPLTAAWALSIHKSQGMTLDSAVVSIGRAFEEGQIYVALSRAKTLAGLKVEGDLSPLRDFKGDRVVLEWLKETFGEEVVMGDYF